MYGDAGAYGGLAGFSGPALDGGSAPVVRYQDLMRTSAPASAGVPEFGRLVNDAPEGFGAEPLPMPVEQAMMGSYGAPMSFPDTDGQYAYTIDPSTQPYTVVITKAPAGAKTGPVPAGTRAHDAIVEQAKAYNPYWFTSVSSRPSTERETAVRAEQVENNNIAAKVSSVASDILTGIGRRGGYIPSGRDEAPKQEVSKDGSQTGTDWGKVALIGGGVLVGVTSLVLITRALTSKE